MSSINLKQVEFEIDWEESSTSKVENLFVEALKKLGLNVDVNYNADSYGPVKFIISIPDKQS